LQDGIDVPLDLTDLAAKSFDGSSSIGVIGDGNDRARTRDTRTLGGRIVEAGRRWVGSVGTLCEFDCGGIRRHVVSEVSIFFFAAGELLGSSGVMGTADEEVGEEPLFESL
jgi:hypothetical protein